MDQYNRLLDVFNNETNSNNSNEPRDKGIMDMISNQNKAEAESIMHTKTINYSLNGKFNGQQSQEMPDGNTKIEERAYEYDQSAKNFPLKSSQKIIHNPNNSHEFQMKNGRSNIIINEYFFISPSISSP